MAVLGERESGSSYSSLNHMIFTDAKKLKVSGTSALNYITPTYHKGYQVSQLVGGDDFIVNDSLQSTAIQNSRITFDETLEFTSSDISANCIYGNMYSSNTTTGTGTTKVDGYQNITLQTL